MIKELHKIFGDDFNFKNGDINKKLYSYQFVYNEEKVEKLHYIIEKLKHDFPEINTGYNIYDGSCVTIYVWFESSIKVERMLKLDRLK